MHAALEIYHNTQKYSADPRIPIEMKAHSEFMKTFNKMFPDWEVVLTEALLFHEDPDCAKKPHGECSPWFGGSCDIMVRNSKTGKIGFLDWKRVPDIDPHSSGKKGKSYPFDQYKWNKFLKYSLQLWLYMRTAERTCDMVGDPSMLIIVAIHPDIPGKHYAFHRAANLAHIADYMLDNYRKIMRTAVK